MLAIESATFLYKFIYEPVVDTLDLEEQIDYIIILNKKLIRHCELHPNALLRFIYLKPERNKVRANFRSGKKRS